MGDMGDAFRDMREFKKIEKEKRLAKADTTGWVKHTEWHYSRTVNGKLLNWWPSTCKAQYDGAMVYGSRTVEKLFKDLKIKELD